MKLSALASRAAAYTSASEAPGFPKRMFSMMVVPKSTGSYGSIWPLSMEPWMGPPPTPPLGIVWAQGVPSCAWEKHPTADQCPTAAPHLTDEADDLPSQPGGVQGGDVVAI